MCENPQELKLFHWLKARIYHFYVHKVYTFVPFMSFHTYFALIKSGRDLELYIKRWYFMNFFFNPNSIFFWGGGYLHHATQNFEEKNARVRTIIKLFW